MSTHSVYLMLKVSCSDFDQSVPPTATVSVMHDELRVAGSSPQLSAMIAAEVSTSLQARVTLFIPLCHLQSQPPDIHGPSGLSRPTRIVPP